jgi:hypothetical protein
MCSAIVFRELAYWISHIAVNFSWANVNESLVLRRPIETELTGRYEYDRRCRLCGDSTFIDTCRSSAIFLCNLT